MSDYAVPHIYNKLSPLPYLEATFSFPFYLFVCFIQEQILYFHPGTVACASNTNLLETEAEELF